MRVTETDENLTKQTDFGVTKHQTGRDSKKQNAKNHKTMMLPVVPLQSETLQPTND